ncbi:MAG: hypothetical protein ACT4PS_08740 [Betaproteobacteria bacterium]
MPVIRKSPRLHGQYYLNKDSGTGLLKLSRWNGRFIVINGAQCLIPSAGVTLAFAGLNVGDVLYIYAYMNAGVMTLEASATVYTGDLTTGVQIKTGDASRTLVGITKIGAGPAWVDSDTQRFVCSWFNLRPRRLKVTHGTVGVASGTFAELDNTKRLEWVNFAPVHPSSRILLNSAMRSSNNTGTGASFIGIQIDAATGVGANYTVLFATIAAVWIISRIPELQRLVRNNTPMGPFNP